ncbi:hypothetical protein CASFOL_004560 [Castilleja foliolosa]|uniref:SMP-LTD domain-containing protein n=1 Tax=Castilleja foliolosa TaxID=1961234 RepID=A0ABD3EB33_9LAMI
MDIDLRWGGDPNIVLVVQAAHVASIPIQLKDLQVFTIVRAISQLSDEIPCISAVVVALLAEPKRQIDYTLKAVGGSLTAIPGLSDMIDDTVTSIVTDMLQWPHRIVVPIGGIPVDIRVLGGFNQTILYSLSPGSGAPGHGNGIMYRITGDHWDKWIGVFSHFNVTRRTSLESCKGATVSQ